MNRPDVEIIDRQTVFKGYFRVDRYNLRYRLFGGGFSVPVTREVFERGNSAAILLYDPRADCVLLVEQFRAGAFAAGIGPWLIECVAGIIEPGEAPEHVARRESMEESGTAPGRVESIGKFIYSSGGCSEICHLFAGEIDIAGAGGVHGLAEEHEDIKTHIVPADEAIGWLDSGKADNAALLIALYWLARHRDRVRISWNDK
jgi:ADP-ribose pyrophosphatase